MIQKQIRNTSFICNETDLISNFPPYQINGINVRNHSLCEVVEETNRSVIALFKLLDDSWYRYDLAGAYPAYPNYPQVEPIISEKVINYSPMPLPLVYIDSKINGDIMMNIPNITKFFNRIFNRIRGLK